MASEILSNLQLGSLIINASKINTLSASTGALISAPATTLTDSSTAASGTLSQFNAHYLAAPTLAATNTGVTTTLANTLTIGGAPIAGTNETLTNAYALNVLAGTTNLAGAVNIGGTMTAPTTGLYIVNNLKTCYGKTVGGGTSQSLSAGNSYQIIMPSATQAPGSSGPTFSVSTGQYTINTAGLYEIVCFFALNGSSTGYVYVTVGGSTNESIQGRLANFVSSSNAMGTQTIPFTVGQVVGLGILISGSGSATAVQGNVQDSWWSIRKVA